MELDKEKALAKEKEKALAIAKEKEKASAEEKENALAKEKSFAKEKQKSLTRQKQEARPLQTIVLKDISVKEEEIGRGASGIVSKVTWHGTECAAKSIHPILVEGTIGDEFNDVKDKFLKECSICACLSHPNIVHFYGLYYPPHSGVPLLIMELMDSSLTKCIAKYPDIPSHMKLSFLHDISLGIRYLHSHEPSIVHRDLSSNNVLITKGGIAKVADLGVARMIDIGCADIKLTRAPGTLDFMPPEALKEDPVYETPLDVFSYGGIMIHCMSGQWPTPKEAVAVDPVTRLVVGFPEQERRSHLIEKMGDVEELKSLTRKCLDNVPEARPSMVEISEKVGHLKDDVIKSSQVAMMNMLDKDIALAKYMTPRLLSDSSEQPTGKPRSPRPRTKSASLKKPLSWRSCDPMPQGMRSPKAVECNGNIYVGGGDTGDQSVSAFKVYVYNISKEKWSSLSPTPQRWFAIAVLKGKLLVIGGACHENAVTGQVTSLDETTGHWYSEYPPVPTSRSDPGAIGHVNHLIVMGGFDGMQSIDVVEVLDASNSQWSQVASLPYTIISVTPMLQGDVLYLAGGLGVTKGKQSSKKSFTCTSIPILLKSTPPGNASSIWKDLSPVPFSYSTTSTHGDLFLTFCGRDSASKQDSSAIYLYDAVKKTWSQVGDMPTCRRMCTAISATTNGKVYVLGGIVNKTKYSDIVECSI